MAKSEISIKLSPQENCELRLIVRRRQVQRQVQDTRVMGRRRGVLTPPEPNGQDASADRGDTRLPWRLIMEGVYVDYPYLGMLGMPWVQIG